MNEVKNKNFILISCGACLVIIMLILYFSGLNVANGSYCAVDLNEYTCSKKGYQVVKDIDGNAKCCPSGYKMMLDFCVPNECNMGDDGFWVECTTVTKECHQKRVEGTTYYFRNYSASVHGKTCFGVIAQKEENDCKQKVPSVVKCRCSCSDLVVSSNNAIKKSSSSSSSSKPSSSSSSSSSCMTQGECQSRYGANNCVQDSNGCWSKSSSSSSSKPSSSSSSSSPSNPSSPSIPSSTPSSTPSSSSGIDENPQTGSIAIFMVWVIALGALVYSFFYFKQSRFE